MPALSVQRAGSRSSRRGTSLIEIMIVMTVLVVAAGLFSQMVIATSQLRGVNRENATAAEAARVVLEEMRNERFRELFYLYNQDPADDPGGPGTAPGHLRAIRELELLNGSATGFQLEIVMPAFPPNTPSKLIGTKWEYVEVLEPGVVPPVETNWTLREDYSDDDLGLPRDLNGDSILDSEDHSKDYILLPVTIRVEWQGMHGPRTYEVDCMLTDFIKS